MPSWSYAVPGTGGGGGGSSIIFQDEGVTLTSALAQIDLTGKAIATAAGNNVTIVIPGAVVDVIAARPAAADANNGEFFWASDTEVMYVSNGTTWTAITITSASITGFNESAQDAVGGILTDTATIDFTYNDGANTITAIVVAGSIGPTQLENTAVAAGSYGSASSVATFTVDADGRLTTAASTAISIASTAVTDFTEAAQDATGAMLVDTETVDLTYTDGTPSLTADYIGGWKQSVRVATTTAGTLASSFENGDTVDGVVLVTGDRILVKDQAAGEENGVRVVAGSGAPARADASDTAAEVLSSMVVVQEGTKNADTVWMQTTNAPITLNTTPLVYARRDGQSYIQIFTGSGTYSPPSGLVLVETWLMTGGGAGGGGCVAAAGTRRAGGGGGSASGVSHNIFTAAQVGTADITVTIAGTSTAGTAQTGVGDGGNGADAGTTSFGALMSLVATFTGGRGGSTTAVSGTALTAGAGGLATALGTYSGGGRGGNGSDGGVTGGAGVSGQTDSAGNFGGHAAGSGGGGGGITAANSRADGGAGGAGDVGGSNSTAGTAGVGAGTAGGNGTANTGNYGGGGGGGGASGSAAAGTAGGTGGNGAVYGAGGGGGGAGTSTSDSGAGGTGAAGIVMVISHVA